MDSTGGQEKTEACDSNDDKRQRAVKGVTAELCHKLEATLREKCEADGNCFDGVYPYHAEFDGEVDVEWIVNPLKYAAHQYGKYVDFIQPNTRVLFVGMNSARKPPTGIPFHENKVHGQLFEKQPLKESFIEWIGNDCIEDSDSGEIFWGVLEKYFGTSKEFFRHCFVINFCPLFFMNKGKNCNISLKKFEATWKEELMNDCSRAYQEIVKILKPDLIVAIGKDQSVWNALKDLGANESKTHLSRICQPIHPTFDAVGLPLEEKTAAWKKQVEIELGAIHIWTEITKEYMVKLEEIGNEAKPNVWAKPNEANPNV